MNNWVTSVLVSVPLLVGSESTLAHPTDSFSVTICSEEGTLRKEISTLSNSIQIIESIDAQTIGVSTTGTENPVEDEASSLAVLHRMSAWERGWNGYDALPPRPDSIENTFHCLSLLQASAQQECRPWMFPNITASADGEVVLEWWHAERKLTLYVSDSSIEYIRSWGSDILNEMDDGEIGEAYDLASAWGWLIGGEISV